MGYKIDRKIYKPTNQSVRADGCPVNGTEVCNEHPTKKALRCVMFARPKLMRDLPGGGVTNRTKADTKWQDSPPSLMCV